MAPDQTFVRISSLILGTMSVVLLISWTFVHPLLPWWASALMLAGAPIAAKEAVHLARKAGAQ